MGQFVSASVQGASLERACLCDLGSSVRVRILKICHCRDKNPDADTKFEPVRRLVSSHICATEFSEIGCVCNTYTATLALSSHRTLHCSLCVSLSPLSHSVCVSLGLYCSLYAPTSYSVTPHTLSRSQVHISRSPYLP